MASDLRFRRRFLRRLRRSQRWMARAAKVIWRNPVDARMAIFRLVTRGDLSAHKFSRNPNVLLTREAVAGSGRGHTDTPNCLRATRKTREVAVASSASRFATDSSPADAGSTRNSSDTRAISELRQGRNSTLVPHDACHPVPVLHTPTWPKHCHLTILLARQ